MPPHLNIQTATHAKQQLGVSMLMGTMLTVVVAYVTSGTKKWTPRNVDGGGVETHGADYTASTNCGALPFTD